MNLTRKNWPLGWNPSADAVNGDPSGLLRMDNLRLDKTGCVSLIDGARTVSSGGLSFVSEFYTKMIGGVEIIWSAFGNPVTSITRSFGGFFSSTSLLVPGAGDPSAQACFGDALGYTLAFSGALRVKDRAVLPNGQVTPPRPLGLLTAGKPTLFVNNRTQITIPCPTTTVEGTGTSPELVLDDTTFEGSLCSPSSLSIDTTAIGGAPADDIGLDIIEFPFTVVDQPANVITSLEIDFILDGDPSDPSTYANYYQLKWNTGDIQAGLNTQANLKKFRFEATRFGSDTLSWKDVIGVRFLVLATQQCTVKFGDITITGGIESGLNGVYNYIQVDVYDDGNYIAKSPASEMGEQVGGATDVTVENGSVRINPGFAELTNTNISQHWFFRRSAPSAVGINTVTGQPLNKSVLNQYYFVGSSNFGQHFTDKLSDNAVLELNADGSLLPNLFLKTLRTQDTVNGLQDFIYAVEGIYNERMLYVGQSFIYLSDRLNLDAIDTRFILRPSGNPTEKNLWLRKLNNNTLILATTKNLYEITGSLVENPDGTIDVRMVPIGEAYPPLSQDVCNFNGGLFYVATDGLRVTTGSNSVNVSPQLRPLFKNLIIQPQPAPISAHGVPAVAIYAGEGAVDYSIVSAHGNIYFACPMQDGTRRVFVYDTVLKTYRILYTDPIKLFATQGDELFAAYGPDTSNKILALEAIPGYGIDGEAVLPIKFRTVFDANEQPRNRKDTFTLKLVLDTGGRNVSVDIQKNGIGVTELDETSWVNLGQVSSNGMSTIYIPLSAENVTLGFRYALQLTDVNGLKTFHLYEATIEYEPRPEQLDYLRILPTNVGTISRKRWVAYAFVIDTLGNNINFTPYLDNVAWSESAVVQTGTKLTFIFFFTSEAIATDMGGILSGGVFEFYGVDLGECVSEKLPPPVKYLVIPADNYGTPNRKRHTSYKFQLLSRGSNVQFTPLLDGIAYAPAIFNTTFKQTVEYFFAQSDGDVIGIDIGGILETLEDTAFEYYGNIRPQTVEVLPDRLQYLRIPNTNFGVASRKRIRTLPLILDSYGTDISFTPIVDGIAGTPQILNSNGKRTVYYYFNTDSFGTDYGGILSGGPIFEFYEMLRPEDVEILPVPKLFDQLGPFRFDKIGKLFGFRLRLIPTGTTVSIPWAIYDDFSPTISTNSNALVTGNLTVAPNYDDIYEVQFAKNVNLTVGRLVLGPTVDPFHRYDLKIKVQTSGMRGESQWMQIR